MPNATNTGNRRSKDLIYFAARDHVQPFKFDEPVVEVFDDMIMRSVPLYEQITTLSAELVAEHAIPGTTVYDLGCSTGNTLILLQHYLSQRCIPRKKAGLNQQANTFNLIGIDNSSEMIDRCRTRLRLTNDQIQLDIIHANLSDIIFKPCSGVVINYTLQFIPIAQRLALLTKIAQALLPNGLIVMTEKVCHHSPRLSKLIADLHHKFKKQRGYSELEIIQKRQSLENVLFPLSERENQNLLRSAGFSESEIIAKAYNFATFVGTK